MMIVAPNSPVGGKNNTTTTNNNKYNSFSAIDEKRLSKTAQLPRKKKVMIPRNKDDMMMMTMNLSSSLHSNKPPLASGGSSHRRGGGRRKMSSMNNGSNHSGHSNDSSCPDSPTGQQSLPSSSFHSTVPVTPGTVQKMRATFNGGTPGRGGIPAGFVGGLPSLSLDDDDNNHNNSPLPSRSEHTSTLQAPMSATSLPSASYHGSVPVTPGTVQKIKQSWGRMSQLKPLSLDEDDDDNDDDDDEDSVSSFTCSADQKQKKKKSSSSSSKKKKKQFQPQKIVVQDRWPPISSNTTSSSLTCLPRLDLSSWNIELGTRRQCFERQDHQQQQEQQHQKSQPTKQKTTTTTPLKSRMNIRVEYHSSNNNGPTPSVWMTPILSKRVKYNDNDKDHHSRQIYTTKMWKVKCVWNVPELDEKEQSYAMEPQNLTACLSKLLQAPLVSAAAAAAADDDGDGDDDDVVRAQGVWTFQTCHDVDGEITQQHDDNDDPVFCALTNDPLKVEHHVQSVTQNANHEDHVVTAKKLKAVTPLAVWGYGGDNDDKDNDHEDDDDEDGFHLRAYKNKIEDGTPTKSIDQDAAVPALAAMPVAVWGFASDDDDEDDEDDDDGDFKFKAYQSPKNGSGDNQVAAAAAPSAKSTGVWGFGGDNDEDDDDDDDDDSNEFKLKSYQKAKPEDDASPGGTASTAKSSGVWGYGGSDGENNDDDDDDDDGGNEFPLKEYQAPMNDEKSSPRERKVRRNSMSGPTAISPKPGTESVTMLSHATPTGRKKSKSKSLNTRRGGKRMMVNGIKPPNMMEEFAAAAAPSSYSYSPMRILATKWKSPLDNNNNLTLDS